MPEYECPSCKSWRGCPSKDYYEYRDVRWCPHQIIWILQNSAQLNAGIYPEQVKGHSKQLRAEGYFVKAKLIIGEVNYRLGLTDNQGELLVTQIEDGRTINSLSPGAYEILMYVKGWRRKTIGFREWERKRRYNAKMARNRDKVAVDKQI